MKLASFVQSFRRAPPRPGASDGRLRVIIELASFDKGGLEKVVLDSALAFDRARIEVTIVTPGTLGHLARRAEQAGIRVVGRPGPNVKLYERELDGFHRTWRSRISPSLAIDSSNGGASRTSPSSITSMPSSATRRGGNFAPMTASSIAISPSRRRQRDTRSATSVFRGIRASPSPMGSSSRSTRCANAVRWR